MFILRRLNWKSKDVKDEVDTEHYDLHQDIWIRCMKQIRDERTSRIERAQNEKLKKELSLNSSKNNTRIIHNSVYKKIAEGGILSHQDNMSIRKTESIHR